MSGNGPVRGRAIDRLRGLAWPMLPMAAAMAAMGGAFSNRAVFYVRDLAQFYYPLHIWYRETVRSGASVLWDPYVGFGQSAIADPARNLMFPPVVLLRLLAPETLGFNLSVALPFPLAALGAFALFRRRVSAQAAALGASVFALSGPVLSTGSFLNMSWTLAVAPWVLLAADRFVETGSGRRFAELAALIALQLLAGEPVTFASTCAVAIGLSVVCARERGERALRAARLLAATLAAYASGACVAAVQLLPLVDATRRSARAIGLGSGYARIGSLHPLQFAECVAPWIFGDPVANYLSPPPVLSALNNGAEPIIYSIYLGVVPVALALVGAIDARDRRWARLWIVVALAAAVWSMGPHTPVYDVATRLVPALGSLRFPSKLMVMLSLALAALAASGWDAVAERDIEANPRRGLSVAAATMLALAAAAVAAVTVALAVPRMIASVADPQACGFLVRTLPATAGRLFVLAAASAALLWIARRGGQDAVRARWLLFAVCVADLLVVSAPLNPTVDASTLETPSWVELTRPHADERIYVGPRIFKAIRTDADIDAPQPAAMEVSEYPDMVVRAREDAELLSFPSRARVRDSISIDQQALWPLNDLLFKEAFKRCDRATRTRALRRVGVRYAITPEPPDAASVKLADIEAPSDQALYDLGSGTPRAYVAAGTHSATAVSEQFDPLFRDGPDQLADVALDGSTPEPSGVEGPACAPEARILDDASTRVAIEACAPEGGGYVVLTDTYDPGWSATVDGAPARVVRANGLFRAVHVASGRHSIVFAYAPRPLAVGTWITVVSLAALGACWVVSAARRRRAA